LIFIDHLHVVITNNYNTITQFIKAHTLVFWVDYSLHKQFPSNGS
jgi:hypothetical protein